ncbi:MAG: hypothetical protein M2R45_03717 [Verrucomicrobia subdivision 3 bacterium]|nr:hypothetical protein [Limisphaerales bacterium]MCS1416959.1 hypothetical protein [Limisphaerales bacterium]
MQTQQQVNGKAKGMNHEIVERINVALGHIQAALAEAERVVAITEGGKGYESGLAELHSVGGRME